MLDLYIRQFGLSCQSLFIYNIANKDTQEIIAGNTCVFLSTTCITENPTGMTALRMPM